MLVDGLLDRLATPWIAAEHERRHRVDRRLDRADVGAAASFAPAHTAVIRLDADDDVADPVPRDLARDLAVQIGEADRSRLEPRDSHIRTPVLAVADAAAVSEAVPCTVRRASMTWPDERGAQAWLDGSTARPPWSRAEPPAWAAPARRPSRGRVPRSCSPTSTRCGRQAVADAIRADGGRATRAAVRRHGQRVGRGDDARPPPSSSAASTCSTTAPSTSTS